MGAIDTRACRTDLDTLLGAIVSVSNQALKIAVESAEEAAKATTLFNNQTHKTRDSIKGTSFGQNGTLSAGKAARYIELGTPPHKITGKNGGYLKFQMNGTTMFRRSVNHPGTKPRPFMTIARDIGEKVLSESLEYFLTYAIERI